MATQTLAALNALDPAGFTAALGWVFEGSPWVAERAAVDRPFASIEALHQAMVSAVRAARLDEQLALIRAHPDLATRVRLTAASTSEQAGAGLDRLAADDFARFQRLNQAYRERFAFPFVIAVRGHTPATILAAFEERLANGPADEVARALDEIARIAWFRLQDAVAPSSVLAPFDPPPCLLLGPGPSNAEPRVLRAQAMALLGQFDPRFTALMNDVGARSRAVFQTANPRCFPVSGTSRAGLEAVLGSLIEDGDRVLVVSCGRFGWLLEDIARRYGAEVRVVEAEWGQVVEPDAVARALAEQRTKLVAIVHGETSTGVLQPLDEIAAACRAHDALLVVDAVVTLGGCEVAVDAAGWDAAIAGLQKCLGGPSGLAPITYNDRVERALAARRTPVRGNYLDLLQLQRYWSAERWNHHTVPTSLVYALHEALGLVLAEGLAARWERHHHVGRAMAAGLAALGLRSFGDRAHALPYLNPVWVPDGVDDERVRAELLYEHGIEIGAAFGPLQGRIWRVGTLGYNARLENVRRLLMALEVVLPRAGLAVPRGEAVAAAAAAYAEARSSAAADGAAG